MVEIILPKVDYPAPPLWANPKLWLAIAIVIVVMAIILIYLRIFAGERRERE